MVTWTYEGTKRGYANLWDKLEIIPEERSKVSAWVKKIIKGEEIYKRVERFTGVPWFWVGAIHMRESGCNFNTHLHNGDPLTARTVHVPAGYPKTGTPPFTWVESAIDALELKKLHKIKDWNISRMGFHAEVFNGTGYVAHEVNSPYVWGSSNLEQKGKYIRDHVWDKDFDDPQVGVLTVIKALCAIRSDIADRIGNPYKQETPVSLIDAEMAAANLSAPMSESQIGKAAKIGGGGLGIAGAVSAAWEAVKDAPDTVLELMFRVAQTPVFWIALVAVGICAYVYFKRKGMRL